MKRFSLTLLLCLVLATSAEAENSKIAKLVGRPIAPLPAAGKQAPVATQASPELKALLAEKTEDQALTETTTAADESASVDSAQVTTAAGTPKNNTSWSGKAVVGEDTFSFKTEAMKMAKGLLAVLALLIVGAAALKRVRGGVSEGPTEEIRILSRKSITTRTQLLVVEVENRRLVLSQNAEEIRFLADLTPPATVTPAVTTSPSVAIAAEEESDAFVAEAIAEKVERVSTPKKQIVLPRHQDSSRGGETNTKNSEALSREALALLS